MEESYEKNVYVLLKFVPKVVTQYLNVKLAIVIFRATAPEEFMMLSNNDETICNLASFYDQDYRAYLVSKSSSNCDDKVFFVGSVPHAQLINNLQETYVFFHPSVLAGFPLAALEAMASGLPIVAYLVGGLVESIEGGKTGVLVEPGDVTALVKASMVLMENENLTKLMGRAGRQVRGQWNFFLGSNCRQFGAIL